jgi:hypothetical protein
MLHPNWLPSKLEKSVENLATRIEHRKIVTPLKPFGHETMYHTRISTGLPLGGH